MFIVRKQTLETQRAEKGSEQAPNPFILYTDDEQEVLLIYKFW